MNQYKKTSLQAIEEEIQFLSKQINEGNYGTEDYDDAMKSLKELIEIRDSIKGKGFEIKSDTVINALVSITSIILITKHEKLDIITTKAFNVATKLIGK